MSKIYKNGFMRLEQKVTAGSYTMFLRLNDDNYIVSWDAKFNHDERTVSWGQGYYDMTEEQAVMLLCEKAKCELSDIGYN